jgi:hypothetical protein
MAIQPYVRSQKAPDTFYQSFKAVRSQRDAPGDLTVRDEDTGRSPVSRWLSWAFDYADFVSNTTGYTGHWVLCQVPRGTMALRAVARVDVAFVGTGNNDIDIGDGNDLDGWLDGADFSSTGLKTVTKGAYNWITAGTGVFYADGDQIEVGFKNATAPTAGEAILFVECISYHEDLSAETAFD